MPPAVNMTQDGKVYAVPEDQVDAAIAQGYQPESTEASVARQRGEVREDIYGGVGGMLGSALAGAARGATFGGSDLALDAIGLGDDVQALKEANPTVSIGAEILGGVSGFGPAGALSRTTANLTAKGTGTLGRAAYAATGAGIEGAVQGGGQYLSSVALEDKPLSAEGFVGAMGKGALFGSVAGGGLSVSESALMRAKNLFPRREVTREAAETVEREAHAAVRSLGDDARTVQTAAKQKLDELRLADAEVRLANSKAISEQKLAQEALKTERQAVMLDRAKNPPKRTRRAFDDQPTPIADGAPNAPIPASSQADGPIASGTGDDLMAQLQGTKQALDGGTPLRDIPRTPEAAKLADAVKANEEALSAYDAWLSKYGKKSEVGKFERAQASRDYAAGMRSKGPGWVDTVPTGEGNAILRRGRQMEWRGSEADRVAAEASITSKVTPEDRLAGDEAAGRLFGGKSIGEDIVDAAAAPKTTDETITRALKPHVGEHVDLGPDLNEAAQVIGRVEATTAELADAAEALGVQMPQAAKDRAKAYRDATAIGADSAAAASAQTADDITGKLLPELARRTGKAVDGDLVGKLGDLGAGLEVLKAVGINVPDVERIPVIGPVLSMYLKARAALGVVKRSGGSVPRTAETVVASKAAATRNRVNDGVASMLDAGARAARKAQSKAGGVAGILSAQLFPSGEKPKKTTDARELYAQRMDELARAGVPGAIRDAVRDRVQVSDPALQAEITAVMERKLGFLSSKAPRPMALPTLLKSGPEWKPSREQLATFAKYVAAAEDPAGVLEDVASGSGVTPEAAETLKAVYPALYNEAQRILLERAPAMQNTLSHARRVNLSILFDVPVDGTMSPSHIQFLQPAQPAAAPMPAQGSPAGAPPTPTISGQVALGDRTMTSLDRRAGA